MAGMLKQPGAFTITPHKVSLCILFKIYAPPGQFSVPFPFVSVAQHNRLGLFLLALTKVPFRNPQFQHWYLFYACDVTPALIVQSCDGILEPKLDELIHQLRLISQDWEASWLIDQLISRLSCLSSPEDLFNFFTDIRG
jgi:anaphase-promoting complex subunit 5